ncbi:MAG: DUF5011 domain-containing protein [Oscillospiraceae bacterium]|nr:DUF5011 domain-containing protein [Oscillospiraceae bacterium]
MVYYKRPARRVSSAGTRNMYRKSNNKRALALTVIVSIAVLLVCLVGFLAGSPAPVIISEAVTMSAGGAIPEASLWFTELSGKASFRKFNVDTDVLGLHEVSLRAGWKSFTGLLHIIDDVPPVVTPVNVAAVVGSRLTPEEFYRDLFDHSSVTAEFIDKPDISKPGIYTVTIQFADEHRNYTVIEADCEIFSVDDEVVFVKGGSKAFDIDAFTTYSDTVDCSFVKRPPPGFEKNIGEYDVILLINGAEFHSKAVVTENVPPAVTAEEAWIFLGEKAESDDFYVVNTANIAAESESTDISSVFVEMPNWNAVGTQNVSVRVVDVIGNYTTVTSVLTIIRDTVKPVIHGAVDIYATHGAVIRYRDGITITDDYDPEPKLTIDSSRVNVNQAGEYPVTYTATDRSGNSSSVTVTVHVYPISREIINGIADERLRNLGVFDTTDPIEQVMLIHAYVFNNVRYLRNLAYPDNDMVMLYTGLMSMQGDCIISQRISELFFERVGIESRRIINIWERHQWNIININGLWYHYDATQYYDGASDTYLFTNARATELNDTVARFDRYLYYAELYPPIQ